MGTHMVQHPLEAQFTLEYQKENGHLVRHTQENSYYFLRVIRTASQQQYAGMCHFYQQYQAHSQQNEDVTRLIKIYQEYSQGFCSSGYTLKLLFEYSNLTIAHEIRTRSHMLHSHHKQYFHYEELCSIAITCLNALNFIQFQSQKAMPQKGSSQRYLYPNMFINTHRLLIMGDSSVRIADPNTISLEDRFQFNQDSYYSPEKVQCFDSFDLVSGKSAIFELAMTLLHIGLLEDIHWVYDDFEAMPVSLQKLLARCRSIYQSHGANLMFFQLLENMLQVNINQRFALTDCMDFIENSLLSEFNPIQDSSPKRLITMADIPSSKATEDLQTHEHTAEQDAVEESSLKPNVSEFDHRSSLLVQLPSKEGVIQNLMELSVNPYESYAYTQKYHEMVADKEAIFTDPALLATIARTLREKNSDNLRRDSEGIDTKALCRSINNSNTKRSAQKSHERDRKCGNKIVRMF